MLISTETNTLGFLQKFLREIFNSILNLLLELEVKSYEILGKMMLKSYQTRYTPNLLK